MDEHPRWPPTELLADWWRRDVVPVTARGDQVGFLAAEATTDDALADVLARYDEPHRRYHTRAHVAAVVQAIDRLLAADPLAADVRDAPAVRVAGWLHDVVYDPTRGDNEAASAAYARDVLTRLGVAAATIDETARLVELTAGHQVDQDDPAGAILLDADLAVLGAPAATYDAYAAQIRAEYAHVPDDAFAAGRAAVLTTFLERPSIFHTSSGAAQESVARANLRRELDAIGDGART